VPEEGSPPINEQSCYTQDDKKKRQEKANQSQQSRSLRSVNHFVP
jgi:hypothetical protein